MSPVTYACMSWNSNFKKDEYLEIKNLVIFKWNLTRVSCVELGDFHKTSCLALDDSEVFLLGPKLYKLATTNSFLLWEALFQTTAKLKC